MYVGDCASTYRNNMFRDYEKHPYGKCLSLAATAHAALHISNVTFLSTFFPQRFGHKFFCHKKTQFRVFSKHCLRTI